MKFYLFLIYIRKYVETKRRKGKAHRVEEAGEMLCFTRFLLWFPVCFQCAITKCHWSFCVSTLCIAAENPRTWTVWTKVSSLRFDSVLFLFWPMTFRRKKLNRSLWRYKITHDMLKISRYTRRLDKSNNIFRNITLKCNLHFHKIKI